jgi:hypothetical protein
LESEQFDQIARLRAVMTRRRLGGVLGGLLAVTMPHPAFEAEAKRAKHRKRKQRRKKCRSPRTACGKSGKVCCAAGEVCQNNICQPQPQALGCTADDSICRGDLPTNIHNCNGDTGFCGSLNDGSPVCMSEAACVACTSARDCISHFQSLVGPEEAQRALCIDSCPHCKQVFGVNTVCIIPAIPLTP